MSERREIGNATLYLGDCLEILPTLGKVDLVITDPPYSVSVAGVGRWEVRYGRTDDLDIFAGDTDWKSMTTRVCSAVHQATKLLTDVGSAYVWCGHRQLGRLTEQFEDAGWKTRFLVWSKKCPVPPAPGSGWPSAAALCLYAYRPGRKWAWDGVCPYRSNVFVADAFRHGNPEKTGHPTQMPIEVIDPLILASSSDGDVVLDPFMGSASTAIACQQRGRKFIGIEIDPRYFAMACERIENAQRQMRMFA